MASTSLCPKFLWTELINISPTHSNYGTTPDHLYYGTISKVDHLRIFGSLCYLHVLKESCSKLESKTRKCFFLGYDDHSKAFRVYDPLHKKIHISHDIIFDETYIGYNHLQQISGTLPDTFSFLESDTKPSTDSPISEPTFPNLPKSPPPFDLPSYFPTSSHSPSHSDSLETPSPEPIASFPQPDSSLPIFTRQYPLQDRKPNSRFRDYFIFTTPLQHSNLDLAIEPRHFFQAIQHLDSAQAIKKEVDSVLDNNTW